MQNIFSTGVDLLNLYGIEIPHLESTLWDVHYNYEWFGFQCKTQYTSTQLTWVSKTTWELLASTHWQTGWFQLATGRHTILGCMIELCDQMQLPVGMIKQSIHPQLASFTFGSIKPDCAIRDDNLWILLRTWVMHCSHKCCCLLQEKYLYKANITTWWIS